MLFFNLSITINWTLWGLSIFSKQSYICTIQILSQITNFKFYQFDLFEENHSNIKSSITFCKTQLL